MTTATAKLADSTRARTRKRQVAARPRKKLSKAELRTQKGRFAAHIERLLFERGWKPADLAARLGLSEPAIRRWLRGEVTPDTMDLERIGKAFDTPEFPLPDYRDVLPPPTG